MPRIMEKKELLESVVEASDFDSFWLDTVRPSDGRATLSFPESISGYDIQVVYIPVAKKSCPLSVKERLHALMARTPVQSGEAYNFRRIDAYDEELA